MEENKNPEVQNPGESPVSPKGRRNAAREKNEKKSSGAGTVILVILLIALLGASGFLMFRDQEKTKIIQAKQERIDADSIRIQQQLQQLNEMEAQLNMMKARAAELELDVDSLQAMIVDIEALKSKLNSAERRNINLSSQINTLKGKISEKETELASIIAERDLALARIDTLQRVQVSLEDTISRISSEKTVLKEKVEIASIMRGEDFLITGVNTKGKEYPGPLFKGKQLAKLKVSFALAENKVAPQNEKAVVMRLIEPDGTVLFSGTDGGSFTSAEGEEMMYTLSQKVQFSGAKQKVSFIYQKGNEYKSGKHKVQFFADGHKIGEKTFVVK